VVRGRMPLPAAWFTLCHVDSSGKLGSRGTACPDPETDGRIWCGVPGRWENGDVAGPDIQRRKLSNLHERFVAPKTAWMQDGDRPRQCPVAPCAGAAPLAPRASSCLATGFSASLQSRSESGGTSLEIDSPPVHAQCLFPEPPGTGQRCSHAICQVVSTQSPVAPIMRNHLRRFV